ncbi:MAG TPA: hypothetical protein PK637_13280 [Flavobacteriales bacterium]|mgnify:CR=1 FL=1|nr:hypothetical protein [Flavobacteriales bacterium]HRJ39365.1 hypothetical protein [Flavobacteriales bacterium]
MKKKEEKKYIVIKAYTGKELSEILGYPSPRAFTTLLKKMNVTEKIGKRIGRYYTPRQVESIIQLVGMKKKVEKKLMAA